MSYRTDQWENLSKDSSGETGFAFQQANRAGYYLEGPSTNDKFIYPDRIVRDMGGRTPAGNAATILKRGYIRNLALGSDDEDLKAPPLRCQFQFNPVTILQTMSQASGVLNFLQQDLAQFAQPLMGQNSFSFELLFDRSMELNSGSTEDPDIDPTSGDLWAQLPPQVGGVLHDLSRLYSIIGVGLSQELVNYATKVYARQAEAEISTKVQSGEDTSGISSLEENESTLASRIDMNVGNSAILMPLPVRVVFSSLYIIEGLVSGVSVRFSKFNAAMVPMQCAVTIAMQAMYVGFAREKTFFQTALQQLANYERQEPLVTQQAEYDAVAEVSSAVKNELSKVSLVLYKSGGTQGKKYEDTAVTLSDITSHFTVTGQGNYSKKDNREEETTLKVFFPNVYTKGVKNSSTYGAIERESLTVEVEWAHMRIYRYISTFHKPTYTVEELADKAVTDKATGASTKRLLAHDYEDDEDVGGLTYKTPDVLLVREVLLNKDKIGGDNSGILSTSTIDTAEDFFGKPDGGDTSKVYSIQQKGNDDRLAVSGSTELLGMLVIDNVDYSQSAIEGSNNTEKVRFLVHARVVVAITDKNGVREEKEAHSSFTIDSSQKFHTYQLKVPNLSLDWNTPGSNISVPITQDDVTNAVEDLTELGLDYIP